MTKRIITQATANRIWNCHREIQVGNTLLTELEKNLRDGKEPNPKDAFGSPRPYQLGIPSGDNSHRLYDLPPRLAVSVIRTHVAGKERELVEACEQARIELGDFEPTAGHTRLVEQV